jgi:hypothetical protein
MFIEQGAGTPPQLYAPTGIGVVAVAFVVSPSRALIPLYVQLFK